MDENNIHDAIYLKSPDGKTFKLAINNQGMLYTEQVEVPPAATPSNPA